MQMLFSKMDEQAWASVQAWNMRMRVEHVKEKETSTFFFPHPLALEVNKSPVVSFFICTLEDL